MHTNRSTLYPPACDFRGNIAKSGGGGGRRILDTLERPLEEPSSTDARSFVSDSAIFQGIRTTRYVTGVLIKRDQDLYRGFLVSDPLCSSQSDPFELSSRLCKERPNLHTTVHGTFRQ